MADSSEQNGARVFISYSRKDTDIAERLRNALLEAGFDAYLDSHNIDPGEKWKARLGDLIASAEKIIFLISPESVASDICEWEIDRAERLGKSILPIVTRETDPEAIPGRLAEINFIFYRTSEERSTGLPKLIKALSTDLAWEREKTRINELAEAWDRAGRPRRLLVFRDDAICIAEAWRDATPATSPPPTEVQRNFVSASRRAYDRRIRTSLSIAVMVAVTTLGLAVLAYWQSELARQNERLAEANAEQAKVERDQALSTQSLFLADLAIQPENTGATGMLLALAGLPDENASDTGSLFDRPYVAQAERALVASLRQNREERILSGHQGRVTDVAFSPDGVTIITTSEDGTARVWDAESGREIAQLRGHTDWLKSVAFNQSGTQVATASGDETVRLWDMSTWKTVAILRGHNRYVETVEFSRDGTRVLTTSFDGTARVWDATDGAQVAVLQDLGGARFANFSPSGELIVSSSPDHTARVRNAESGEEIAILRGHAQSVSSASFSPDGTWIVTASGDATARVWRRTTNNPSDWEETAILRGHRYSLSNAVFTEDSKRILTISADRTVRVWSRDGLNGSEWIESAVIDGHEDALSDAVFGANDDIVTVSQDGSAMVWREANGDSGLWEQIAVLRGHCDQYTHHSVWGCNVTSAVFSPNGETVVTASDDRTARVWRIPEPGSTTGLHDAMIQRGDGTIEDAAWSATFSPDGTEIAAVVDKGGELLMWSAETLQRTARLTGESRNIRRAAFSPEGQWIVTSGLDGEARVWRRAGVNESEWEEVAVLADPEGEITTADVSFEASWIVAGSKNGSRRIWERRDADGREWDEIFVAPGHNEAVTSVSIGPEQRFVLSTSEDNTVRVWDMTTASDVATLEGVDQSEDDSFYWLLRLGVLDASYAFDGNHIAIVSWDDVTRIWRRVDENNSAAWEQVSTLEGNTFGVESAEFNFDGSQMVTGLMDGTAVVWRRSSLEEHAWDQVAILPVHHDKSITSAAFSPDGGRIVTSSDGGTIKVWHAFASTQHVVDHAKKVLPRCLSPDQREQFFLPPEPERWCVTGAGLENEEDPSKWRPKWPYRTTEWRDWLVARDRNEDPPLPKSSEIVW